MREYDTCVGYFLVLGHFCRILPTARGGKRRRDDPFLLLGAVLLTRHNLYYYQELMAGLRGAIQAGKLADFTAAFEAEQEKGDIEAL